MLILTSEHVEQVLNVRMCLEAIEESCREMAEGNLFLGNLEHLSADQSQHAYYDLLIASAIPQKLGSAIVRVASAAKRVVEAGGAKRRLLESGRTATEKPDFMLLFETERGKPLAIVQNRLINAMRVGANAAVFAKYLAGENCRTMGVLGSGWQAEAQLLAHCAIRGIEQVKIFSPNGKHRENFAKRMAGKLGIEVRPVSDPQEVLRGAHIVSSATNSSKPTFDPQWLEPGSHVFCIHAEEYDERIFRKADLIGWCYPEMRQRISEHRSGSEEQRYRGQMWDLLEKYTNKRVYLSDLVLSRGPRRTNERQITFVGSPANGGGGLCFSVLVPKVYEMAKVKGLGHVLPDEWFS